GRQPMRSNSAIAEGTVLIKLTLCRCSDDARARASSTRSTEPPHPSVTKISKTDRSKQIDVQASTCVSSSGLKSFRAHAHSATALAWRIMTPFGLPVEPEV